MHKFLNDCQAWEQWTKTIEHVLLNRKVMTTLKGKIIELSLLQTIVKYYLIAKIVKIVVSQIVASI